MADTGRMRAAELAAQVASASEDELREFQKRYADDPRKQVRSALKRAERRLGRDRVERERVLAMYARERELASGGVALGVDEVGRGALAGPLTVAAVALPTEPVVWGVNDSKQLAPARRESLAERIEEVALAIGIAHIPPARIDRIGMAAALREAMRIAIEDADIAFDAVLIDGNPVHVHDRERCVVKGDARVASIAAASIVAKVTRDALMVGLDEEYPRYHLAACKGYGSAEHLQAIRDFGLTPVHRVSFCGNIVETPTLF